MKIKTVGTYAIFQDREYEFEQHDGGFWLASDDPNDRAFGFQEVSLIKDRFILKNVPLEQLSLVFRKETWADFDGLRFRVSYISGGQILLNFSDKSLRKKYAGQKRDVIVYDRQDYYMYVPLKEIAKLEQVWIPYTPTSDSASR